MAEINYVIALILCLTTVPAWFLLIDIYMAAVEYMRWFDRALWSKMLNSIAEKTLFTGIAVMANQFYALGESKEYFDVDLLGFSIPIIVSGIILTKWAKLIGEDK
jgi:hypothetical protein